MWKIVLAWAVVLISAIAMPAQAQNQTVASFREAKKLIYGQVYRNDRRTLYCDVSYDRKRRPNVPKSLTTEKHKHRHKRIEVEHITSASDFGRSFKEYREGHPKCVTKKGRAYVGRKCAEKVNPTYRYMLSDLHNLAPALGSVNATRSHYRFSELPESETNDFGSCDFKISNDRKVEPPERAKGVVSRAHLYMDATYSAFTLSPAQRKLFEVWNTRYPPKMLECERNALIAKIQGNSNPFIDSHCRP